MSAKHTPGPWEVDEYGVSSEAVLGIARTYHAATRVMWSGSDFATLAHCEANARLIAAAPELLEALQLFLTEYVALVNSGDAGFWDAEDEEKVKRARAAIAKATGEQA